MKPVVFEIYAPIVDCLKQQQAVHNRYGWGEACITTRDVQRQFNRSWNWAHRRLEKGVADGVLLKLWTHRHRYYWEAQYYLTDKGGRNA